MISIIIPIYNGENYINRMLECIEKQTFTNYEVILVNDGSYDATESICLKYTESNKKFKYIFQENGGVATARNNGIDNSTGEYIVFLDADDYIENDYLECLYRELRSENNIDMVIYRINTCLGIS